MSNQITDNRTNVGVKCVSVSKSPPCTDEYPAGRICVNSPLEGYGQKLNCIQLEPGTAVGDIIVWNGANWIIGSPPPLQYTSYSGPTAGANVPAIPVTEISIEVLAAQNNMWFGISDQNATALPVGGQDILQEVTKTTNTPWQLGTVIPGGGNSVITRLTPGKYDISFSMGITFSGSFEGQLIVALGTHLPGGTFAVDGFPIIQPQAASTKLYNVGIFEPVGFGGDKDPREIAARGGVTVTTDLENVGLIARPTNTLGDFTYTFSTINMTVTRIE